MSTTIQTAVWRGGQATDVLSAAGGSPVFFALLAGAQLWACCSPVLHAEHASGFNTVTTTVAISAHTQAFDLGPGAGSKPPEGWTLPDFNDSGWDAATPVAPDVYACVKRPRGWGSAPGYRGTEQGDSYVFRIVHISSDATAKAGLHGLSRTLAVELGPANILSNVLLPSMVLTERVHQRVPAEYQEQVKQHTPTRRITTPDDVAVAIVFLGSQANRQITGEIIRMTGGR